MIPRISAPLYLSFLLDCETFQGESSRTFLFFSHYFNMKYFYNLTMSSQLVIQASKQKSSISKHLVHLLTAVKMFFLFLSLQLSFKMKFVVLEICSTSFTWSGLQYVKFNRSKHFRIFTDQKQRSKPFKAAFFVYCAASYQLVSHLVISDIQAGFANVISLRGSLHIFVALRDHKTANEFEIQTNLRKGRIGRVR